jgi:lipopolysaccharide transport system ATP-binding protein
MPSNQEQSTMNQELSKLPERQGEVLVKVEGVSKKFCRDLKKSLWYGMKDVASELLPFSSNKEQGTKNQEHSPGLRPGEFWANKDISFELRRGECLGLIGRNGAGKTTLLKMLNGLIKPDSGSIEMRGRVGALIALGAGFNPILTGRENIYVNGSILGLTREEISAKMDEIIEFAEVGEFIDSPVQSYSSGMQVRLGFAVSTALDPDILIVDEVLAVGDTNFKVKCYNKIKQILPKTAVIFVSHNMFDVCRICDQVTVLKKGQTLFHGDLEEGVHIYNEINEENTAQTGGNNLLILKDQGITNASLRSFEESCEGIDASCKIELEVTSAVEIGKVRSRIVFFDEGETPVGEWDSANHNIEFEIHEGTNLIRLQVNRIRLKSGKYRMATILTEPSNSGYIVSVDRGLFLTIKSPALSGASYKI